jgi:DNA-binding transcriptional MerR regulator
MNDTLTLTRSPSSELDLFQPRANTLYGLDAAAHLANVSRRALLIYCREGLIQPVLQAPHGMMVFNEETIYTVRRIEHMRQVHGVDVALIKTIFDLLNEIERLRSEVRFLRSI